MLTSTTKLTVIECGVCAVPFAIPESMHAKKLEDGSAFWCPNGHSVSYHETEADRLRKRLKLAEVSRNDGWAAWQASQDQLRATERSLRGTKAAKTRLRNQIAKGICPCCKRNFANVRAHMAGQHPEFAAPKDES